VSTCKSTLVAMIRAVEAQIRAELVGQFIQVCLCDPNPNPNPNPELVGQFIQVCLCATCSTIGPSGPVL
jgi:hypothetical protein